LLARLPKLVWKRLENNQGRQVLRAPKLIWSPSSAQVRDIEG